MTYPISNKSRLIAFCSSAALMFAASAYANAEQQQVPKTDRPDGVQAVEKLDPVWQGYDLVSYFSETGPERGHKAHYLSHNGKLYSFSSAENLKQFKQDPAAYLPQYEGNCALAMAFGKHVKSDPTTWKIVEGKLYMLSNSGAVAKWEKKTAKFIAKADAKWAKISKG